MKLFFNKVLLVVTVITGFCGCLNNSNTNFSPIETGSSTNNQTTGSPILIESLASDRLCLDSNGNVLQYNIGPTNEITNQISNSIFDSTTSIITNVKKIYEDSLNTSFVLKKDSTLWGWKANHVGELGVGTTTQAEISLANIRQVSSDVKDVFRGQYSTFILKNDDSLWGCGLNIWSGPKIFPYSQVLTPTAIFVDHTLNKIRSVCFSGDFAMIIDANNNLYYCGDRYSVIGTFPDVAAAKTYAPVKIMTNVKKVISFNLILKTDGTLWINGYNKSGQLGIGKVDSTYHYSFEKIASNVLDAFADSTEFHTQEMYITNDGNLYACGDNFEGSLGDGTKNPILTPKLITTNVKSVKMRIVNTPNYYTEILKNDGTLWICGSSSYGYNGKSWDGTDDISLKQTASDVIDYLGYSIIKTDGNLYRYTYQGFITNGIKTSSYTWLKRPVTYF